MTRWSLVALVVLSVGCGAGLEDAPPQPKWSSLYSTYLKDCAQCHAPNAPGKVSDTETSLDFSTAATGYQTVRNGSAAGLVGNFASCNGVKFVTAGNAAQSLLVASLDSSTRAAFSSGSCDGDTISDQTVKLGGTQPSAAWMAALKQWINDGAANN